MASNSSLSVGLQKFKKSQQVLEKIFSELPLQQVMLLLAIAEEPQGITQPTLAKKLDWPQGTVSRNVKKLSVYLEQNPGQPAKKKGYDLVEQRPDLSDRKTNIVYLTPKGKRILKEISDVIEN